MKQKTLATAICFLICLSSVSVLFAQGKNTRVSETTFEFDKNLIFVQVRINGKGPLRMMLDTGTDPSVIDIAETRHAVEIGLQGGRVSSF